MANRRPRIAPLKREDAAPQVEAMYKRMDAMGNPPPNMHLTFGKNPGLYEKWLPFATYIIPASSLAHRDRQILILRSAYSWRCGLCLVAARRDLPAPRGAIGGRDGRSVSQGH